jgi:hypothetical protein
MKRATWIFIIVFSVAAMLIVLRMATVSRGQGDDDYAAISRMTTLNERQQFFRSLSTERKSALWRKHYRTELTKHPELTADQKSVVDLAIVMASPDLFGGKLPDAAGPGSIFEKALANAFKDDRALGQEIFGSPAPPLAKPAQPKDSKPQ